MSTSPGRGVGSANDGAVLRTADLDYALPSELIAREPARPRDSARLLVVRRGSGGMTLTDSVFRDLPGLLGAGDLMVVNTSRVLPARLRGVRADTGGRFEGLFVGQVQPPQRGWRVLIRAKRPRPGVVLVPTSPDGKPSATVLRLVEPRPEPGEEGAWLCVPEGEGAGDDAPSILARIGWTPIPPYIQAARRRGTDGAGGGDAPSSDTTDRADYQTAYADIDPARAGSVAAPTAGLHFTQPVLDALTERGVGRASVTLHVGAGTFKPVETEFVEEHPIHAEWCEVPAETARAIVATRRAGSGGQEGRVVAVGTTSARTLESFGPAAELVDSGAAGWSSLLVTPGYRWRNVDALLTNFHLPGSTLMALVAALLPGGVPDLLAAYRHAIDARYRFYSYGDAMLIL
ncbi:MAG: tRNA preQ1(34) S-adenosylmethionine ribosyltransferase-isomerase QueA [Phycisphaerae bacterium]|nr:tRNA preQ1(34) S-adenosylmethionine ribosyltransferase-isomerase QueA [Phycisphaerae bacterium]